MFKGRFKKRLVITVSPNQSVFGLPLPGIPYAFQLYRSPSTKCLKKNCIHRSYCRYDDMMMEQSHMGTGREGYRPKADGRANVKTASQHEGHWTGSSELKLTSHSIPVTMMNKLINLSSEGSSCQMG